MTHQEPLGSAAHEAGRLVEALRDWLDARGVPEAPIATDSAECKACPVCLVLSAVREHHPEVVVQLGRAAEALTAAARALLIEQEEQWVRGRTPDVEHIDIDEP